MDAREGEMGGRVNEELETSYSVTPASSHGYHVIGPRIGDSATDLHHRSVLTNMLEHIAPLQ